jgi:hypothetical protein
MVGEWLLGVVLRLATSTSICRGSVTIRSGFKETIGTEEAVFNGKTFLVIWARATHLKESPQETVPAPAPPPISGGLVLEPPPSPNSQTSPLAELFRSSVRKAIPPKQWNKLGAQPIPKYRSASDASALNLQLAFGYVLAIFLAISRN